MLSNEDFPLLIRYVIGDSYIVAVGVIEERLVRWAEAFDTWLAERESQGGVKVRRIGEMAWFELLSFTMTKPWQISTNDVQAWVVSQERGVRCASTIQGRLTAISKFYDYIEGGGLAKKDHGLSGEGVVRLESEYFNPVKGVSRPQPPPRKCDTTRFSPEQVDRMMRVAESDRSPLGTRDFALISLALFSGQRLDPLRKLQMSDITLEENQGWVLWERGKVAQKEPLFGTALAAIREHLAQIQIDGKHDLPVYIFSPAKSVCGTGSVRWVSDRPLTRQQVLRIVRQYVSWVGLKAEQVTWQTLRNTSVAMRAEQGDPLEKIHAALGRSEISKTRAYLRKLLERPKYIEWADGHSPDVEPENYNRGRAGAKPRHGYYSKYLLYYHIPLAELHAMNVFEREKARLNLVMARAEELYQAGRREKDIDSIRQEMIRILLVQMEATYRIARLKITLERIRKLYDT